MPTTTNESLAERALGDTSHSIHPVKVGGITFELRHRDGQQQPESEKGKSSCGVYVTHPVSFGGTGTELSTIIPVSQEVHAAITCTEELDPSTQLDKVARKVVAVLRAWLIRAGETGNLHVSIASDTPRTVDVRFLHRREDRLAGSDDPNCSSVAVGDVKPVSDDFRRKVAMLFADEVLAEEGLHLRTRAGLPPANLDVAGKLATARFPKDEPR